MLEKADLGRAYRESFYTICGAGGELSEWTTGIQEMLTERGIGTVKEWFQTTGAEVNRFADEKAIVVDPFPDDVTILMFPYEGLDVGKLAILKLMAGDRWFDDVVENMTERDWSMEEDEDES